MQNKDNTWKKVPAITFLDWLQWSSICRKKSLFGTFTETDDWSFPTAEKNKHLLSLCIIHIDLNKVIQAPSFCQTFFFPFPADSCFRISESERKRERVRACDRNWKPAARIRPRWGIYRVVFQADTPRFCSSRGWMQTSPIGDSRCGIFHGLSIGSKTSASSDAEAKRGVTTFNKNETSAGLQNIAAAGWIH